MTWILRLKILYTHTHTKAHTRVCVHISVCVCVCVYTRVHYLCARTHVHTYACTHACMHIHMYVCTHACMYVCMYVCTQCFLLGKKVEGRTHETMQMTKAILAYFIKVLKQTVQVLHHQKRRQSLSPQIWVDMTMLLTCFFLFKHRALCDNVRVTSIKVNSDWTFILGLKRGSWMSWMEESTGGNTACSLVILPPALFFP
jgi:hypothetical protein